MSARPFYETIYHRNDWRLADAFRPQPGWGRRRFTVPAAALEGLTEADLIAGAQASAPEGYRLTSLSIHPEGGSDRVIWRTAPDTRFTPPAAAKEPQP